MARDREILRVAERLFYERRYGALTRLAQGALDLNERSGECGVNEALLKAIVERRQVEDPA